MGLGLMHFLTENGQSEITAGTKNKVYSLLFVCSVRTLPFDELIQHIQVDEQSSFFTCKV